METSTSAISEHHLVQPARAIAIKGSWHKISKPKIVSFVTPSKLNQALLNISPYGFSLSWSFFKWVETIPEYNHSLQSNRTMICLLTKQRHFKTAQDLLGKVALRDFLSSPPVLKSLVNRNDDANVNSHVLSWLVIFYSKSKMNLDALQVFDHMRVWGYKPHSHACTVLLDALQVLVN